MSTELLVEIGEFPAHVATANVPSYARPIVARLKPGLLGIRAEVLPSGELVEIGFPELPDFLFFKPVDDVSAEHNAVSLALYEIISRRGVTRVRFSQLELWACIRKSLAETSAEAYFGTHLLAREDFRPPFDGLACEPGEHWTEWARNCAEGAR